MSSVRRPHGRLFQIRGPAAPKLLSPKLLSLVVVIVLNARWLKAVTAVKDLTETERQNCQCQQKYTMSQSVSRSVNQSIMASTVYALTSCSMLPEFLPAFPLSAYSLGAKTQIYSVMTEPFSSAVHDFCSNYVYVLHSLDPSSAALFLTCK